MHKLISRIIWPWLGAVGFLSSSSLAWAAPGDSGAHFLNFGQGPRAVAMGESQTAVAEDAYAAYWNPAGLATLQHAEAAMTYNKALEGVDQQYLSLAYPLRYGSTLNLNFTRLGMSSFDSYDAQGIRTGAVDAGDYALGLAYGRTVLQDAGGRPLLSAGLNLKGIHERLASATARTFAADIGLLSFWRPSKIGEFRMGFAAQNLGPGLKFDRVTADLPTAYRIGFAWQGKPKGDTLTLSLDQVLSQEEGHYLAAGAEYTVWRILAFRLGYRMGQDIGLGFRGGVGFKLKALEISYAYAGFGDLGIMHRMGISIRMGALIETTPPEEQALGAIMEKAKRLMKERRYYEAILEYDKALESDPGNKMALEGMRRAHGMLEMQK